MLNAINGSVHGATRSGYSTLSPRVALPQRPPHPISSNSRRIIFNYNEAGAPGVHMSTIKCHPVSALSTIIANGSERITHPIILWIKWAGYENVPWDGIRVNSTGLTRAEVAKRVVQCFDDFIKHAQSLPIDPAYAQFRAGTRDASLEKLVLVSLANMVGELWTAEVMVEKS